MLRSAFVAVLLLVLLAGHAAAIEYAYKGIPADGPPPNITAEYIERARPIIEQRLQRGGVRLADVLERAMR